MAVWLAGQSIYIPLERYLNVFINLYVVFSCLTALSLHDSLSSISRVEQGFSMKVSLQRLGEISTELHSADCRRMWHM